MNIKTLLFLLTIPVSLFATSEEFFNVSGEDDFFLIQEKITSQSMIYERIKKNLEKENGQKHARQYAVLVETEEILFLYERKYDCMKRKLREEQRGGHPLEQERIAATLRAIDSLLERFSLPLKEDIRQSRIAKENAYETEVWALEYDHAAFLKKRKHLMSVEVPKPQEICVLLEKFGANEKRELVQYEKVKGLLKALDLEDEVTVENAYDRFNNITSEGLLVYVHEVQNCSIYRKLYQYYESFERLKNDFRRL